MKKLAVAAIAAVVATVSLSGIAEAGWRHHHHDWNGYNQGYQQDYNQGYNNDWDGYRQHSDHHWKHWKHWEGYNHNDRPCYDHEDSSW